MPDDLRRQAKQAAAAERRTFSSYIQHLIARDLADAQRKAGAKQSGGGKDERDA